MSTKPIYLQPFIEHPKFWIYYYHWGKNSMLHYFPRGEMTSLCKRQSTSLRYVSTPKTTVKECKTCRRIVEEKKND